MFIEQGEPMFGDGIERQITVKKADNGYIVILNQTIQQPDPMQAMVGAFGGMIAKGTITPEELQDSLQQITESQKPVEKPCQTMIYTDVDQMLEFVKNMME